MTKTSDEAILDFPKEPLGRLDTRWETSIFPIPDLSTTQLCVLRLHDESLVRPAPVATIYQDDGEEGYVLVLGTGGYVEHWTAPILRVKQRAEEIWPFRGRRYPEVDALLGPGQGREKRV